MTEYNEDDEVTMDSLFDNEVNSAEAEAIVKRAQKPAGTYQTQPEDYPMTVIEEKEQKSREGEVYGTRKQAIVNGLVVATIKGEEVKARVRFKLSPEGQKAKIYVNDEWTGEFHDTKDDSATKLWGQAVLAYKETFGDFPAKGTELLDFLKTGTYRLRLMPGRRDDEMVVLAISAVGKRR
jgi:hypothetical protein